MDPLWLKPPVERMLNPQGFGVPDVMVAALLVGGTTALLLSVAGGLLVTMITQGVLV